MQNDVTIRRNPPRTVRRRQKGMKKTAIAKIFVDIAMLMLFLQLTYGYDMSPTFHEIAGIMMGCLFGAHMALNWKSFKAMFRLLRRGKLPTLKIVSLVLDLLFIVAMPLCVVTGLLIARNLYIGPGGLGVSVVHTTTANIALYVMVGHVVLHARYIAVYIKQTMQARAFQRATGFAGACMLVFGLLGANVVTGLNEKNHADAATTTAQTTSSSTSASGTSTSSNQTAMSTSNNTSANTGTTPTNCTLCKKMCPLSALECTKGVNWAENNGYI